MRSNAGMLYQQNARPDGPLTWAFRWFVELHLRW